MLAKVFLLSLCAVVSRAEIAVPGVSLTKGLTQAEKTALLNEHNAIRQMQAEGKVPNQPAAADMTRLEWSDETAAHAQKWADNCGGPAHGNHKEFGEGQNYASNGDRGALLKGAMNDWFHEEHPSFIYPDKSSSGTTGHYTQIVTAYSLKLGCGANKCADISNAWGRLICNFYVAGNMLGKPPFQKGAACSKCPEGYEYCKDSLCTSARICSSSDSSCHCTVDKAKCSVNGKFNAEKCSCDCKVGFQGLNCEAECLDIVNKGCPQRAREGGCKPSATNGYFVDTYLSCPASCGQCAPACKNHQGDAMCENYKRSGNCEVSKPYMEQNCPKVCGFCA